MAVHHEVLDAARRTCRSRRGWRFRPIEIVRALPHLNPATVRTHVVSRCCTNAPVNHPHRWDYFERVARGQYEIRRPYRVQRSQKIDQDTGARAASEPAFSYGAQAEPCRDTVHAVVSRGGGWYTAECLEIAVVTQGRTLDELVHGLQEAVELHLAGEDPATLGLVASPRLAVTYEFIPPAG